MTGKQQRPSQLDIYKTAILMIMLTAGYLTQDAHAHGSMEIPISRVYNCYLEGPENPRSAACRAAVRAGGTQALYDWNGVNRLPDGRHRETVPDGQLCSAGKASHRGLDLARDDWPTTLIAPDRSGNFEFVYRATAPHSTDYFEFYVTRDGYNPSRPLRWRDLESSPFCRVSNVRLENGRYRVNCPLPQGKTGKHVIYHIWQRDDSPEAFYACIDVVFRGDTGPDPTTDWRELGQVRAREDLPVDSTVTFRLFNRRGRDVESHRITLQDRMNRARLWPYHLARVVNDESDFVNIGVLADDGTITPVRSARANRVYVRSDDRYTFQIDIDIPDDDPDNPACQGVSAWDPVVLYFVGDQVTFEGSLYESVINSRNARPTLGIWWEQIGSCQ
ncbi:lytic polysaccharide monooxygenase [Candidatus Entotheonella palauensis]|uniref:lytic polysaccharide monooxygenase n=1 Tax=Candidatus Entotheonella palauensis TaxID=93172 RepID=UPI000B7F068D|nr:lytic polysaccharide monooxygenase [Candidatus Entotheonella palauensis]